MVSMACRMHDGHQESRVQTRKSYTREYKLRKYQNTLENSLGTCPTIVLAALRTATTRRS